MQPVRLLSERDLPALVALKDAAAWNQTGEDWRNLLRLSPAGCFGIDCDAALVATATAVCYADRLAWIGMVLTHPGYRGRGFARRLMQQALAWIEARGADWIKLDATDMGRPLYASLGFVDECPIERWGRPPGAAGRARALPPASLCSLSALDCAAFGADRSALLEVLAPFGSAGADGAYAMGRPGSKAAYFGPAVAISPDAARDLVAWYVAGHAGETVYWDILPANAAAVVLAREFGFAPLRRLVRMARPGRAGAPAFAHDDSKVFAIAGFEYG